MSLDSQISTQAEASSVTENVNMGPTNTFSESNWFLLTQRRLWYADAEVRQESQLKTGKSSKSLRIRERKGEKPNLRAGRVIPRTDTSDIGFLPLR